MLRAFFFSAVLFIGMKNLSFMKRSSLLGMIILRLQNVCISINHILCSVRKNIDFTVYSLLFTTFFEKNMCFLQFTCGGRLFNLQFIKWPCNPPLPQYTTIALLSKVESHTNKFEVPLTEISVTGKM